MILVLWTFACGWLLGLLFPWRMTAPAVRILLERARFDLERGWPAAAYDNLGRALALLTSHHQEKPHGN